MKFNTWLSCVHGTQKRFTCCSGTREIDKQHLVINKAGYPVLETQGKTNLYAQIQSYKDTCDLEAILRTFDLGKLPALSFDDLGDLTDFTDAPKSAGELLKVVKDGELMFSQLPVGVRNEFNHSLYNFIGSFGSPDFGDRLAKAYGVHKDLSSGDTSDVGSVLDTSGVDNSPIVDVTGDPDYPSGFPPAVDVKQTVEGGNSK